MTEQAMFVADVGIRRDEVGRFCLNDLHRAAGEEARHRPNYWLENQQTKDLAAEIAKAGIPAIEAKQGLGTFVAKELVYAYAMWISAVFHLKVIRAYDAMVSGRIDPNSITRSDMARMILDAEQEIGQLKAEVAKVAPVVAGMDRIANSSGTMCITNAAKALQMKPKALFAWMEQRGWIYRRHGSMVWCAFAERLKQGVLMHKVTTIKPDDGDERVVERVLVTAKGLARLAVLLETPLPADLSRLVMEASNQ